MKHLVAFAMLPLIGFGANFGAKADSIVIAASGTGQASMIVAQAGLTRLPNRGPPASVLQVRPTTRYLCFWRAANGTPFGVSGFCDFHGYPRLGRPCRCGSKPGSVVSAPEPGAPPVVR